LRRPLGIELVLCALEAVDPARVIDYVREAHGEKGGDPTAGLDRTKLELLAQLRRLVVVERAKGA
jgi:hypothetical protein